MNTCVGRAADIASKRKTEAVKRRSAHSNCLCRADRAGIADRRSLPRHVRGTGARLAVRRILGVLSLAKKYGVARLWMTHAPPRLRSAYANTISSAAIWRGIRNWPLSLPQVDPLIRELTIYRDFIDNKTRENKE